MAWWSIRTISSPRSQSSRRRASSITPDVLRIADNAPLILSLHRELDALRENSNSGLKIGTTRRGIGPAYEDKVGRRAIRVCDLAEPDTLMAKIERLLAHHNALRRGMGAAEVQAQAIHDELTAVADQILPFMDQVWRLLDERRKRGARILFEGAQGALLDNDHGTYPFVTSSNTVAGQAAAGSGLGPTAIGYVLGITKAYTTRVGEGPFPTEQDDEIGQFLGERATSSASLPGASAAAAGSMRCSCARPSGLRASTGSRLTKLDVLDGLEEIKVCVGYELDGKRIDYLPASMGAQVELSRSMKPSRGGKKRQRGRAAGPNCRLRRSNMSAISKS